jgi:C-terminal processing protease CtpA/Prc
VVYWRVSSFTPATSWAGMAAQANKADAVNSPGLVIDLRNNTTPDDFNGALQVANFVSEGQSGLVVRDGAVATGAPVTVSLHSHPTIVVLTNRQTRGAAEALAACLKAHGALVMGEATEGKAAVFKEVPLASGGVLRYAAAHVYLADGTDLWNKPVVPDVTTAASEKDEDSALALIDQKQVSEVIGEADSRHRMSEAALVQGQDPEQDEFLASHEKSAPLPLVRALPVTRDVALVEAIDSLKAIRVLQGQEISASPTVAVR